MRRLLIALVCGLVMGLPILVTQQAHADESWGSVSAPDQKLHRGCHSYAYSYRVTPPTDEFSAETFLVGPQGKRLGSGYFLSGGDPATGTSAWRLCRRSLVAGTYTIKMRVSYIDGYDLITSWVKPARFRLTHRG